MNKILIVTLCILALIITGCGTGTNQEAKKVSNAPATTTTPDKSIYKLNDVIELKGNVLTVTNVKKSKGTEYEKPKNGYEFLIVYIKLVNKSNDRFMYNSFDFKVQNSKGVIVDQSFRSIDNDTRLEYGELNPNGEVTGTLVFETPVDDSKLILEYKPSFWSDNTIKIYLNK